MSEEYKYKIETEKGTVYTNDTDIVFTVLGIEVQPQPSRTYTKAKVEKSDGGYRITHGNSVVTVSQTVVNSVSEAVVSYWDTNKKPISKDILYRNLEQYSRTSIDRALRGLVEVDKQIQNISSLYFPRDVTSEERDSIRKQVYG